MTDSSSIPNLLAEHTESAIRLRLNDKPKSGYLKDIVWGAVDGTVTTFAIVAGACGAGLSNGVVVILGIANVLGDGFSMAVGNFLATRSENELREKARKTEERHIALVPDGEREEIRQIYHAKGFSGEALESVVRTITSDKKLWVETMLREEWGFSAGTPSPLMAAAVTFTSFLAAGLVPLTPFIVYNFSGAAALNPFTLSALLTGLTFFGVGAFKGLCVKRPWWKSGCETLLLGAGAALLAFLSGTLLRDLIR